MNEQLPQSYQRIEDIVIILERVHSELARVYGDAGKAAGETRTGMLLDTFRERQERLAAFMATSLESSERNILNTWIQFIPSEGVNQILERIRERAVWRHHLPDDWTRDAVQLQNDISSLLQSLVEEVTSEDARKFLNALFDREHGEAKTTAESLQGLEDV